MRVVVVPCEAQCLPKFCLRHRIGEIEQHGAVSTERVRRGDDEATASARATVDCRRETLEGEVRQFAFQVSAKRVRLQLVFERAAAIRHHHTAPFLNRTPGPPPFSAMNSTPAASRAERMAAAVDLRG